MKEKSNFLYKLLTFWTHKLKVRLYANGANVLGVWHKRLKSLTLGGALFWEREGNGWTFDYFALEYFSLSAYILRILLFIANCRILFLNGI